MSRLARHHRRRQAAAAAGKRPRSLQRMAEDQQLMEELRHRDELIRARNRR